MGCLTCSNQSKHKFQGNNYCNRCYTKLIYKRLRKYLRANKFFKKNDKLLVFGEYTATILKELIQGLPVKLKINKNTDIKGILKTKIPKNHIPVIPWTLEDEICLFLEEFFDKSNLKNLGPKYNNKYIKLFRPITEPELKLIAKHKPKPRKKDKITQFLNTMEKKYPQTRFSLLSSVDQLISHL